MPAINVPGIGEVFADGFAEESTMQRILAVLQSSDNANSPEALARLSSAAGGLGSGFRRASRDVTGLSGSADSAATSLNNAGMTFNNTSRNLSRNMDSYGRELQNSMRTIADSPFGLQRSLIEAGGKMIDSLSGMFADKLPVVGGALGALTKAAGGLAAFIAGQVIGELEKTNAQFVNAQKNGALLGGSLLNLRIVSSAAGLNMEQFNGVLQKAGQSMSMFGGQTGTGAIEFARQNRVLINDFGPTLQRMGMGFEEMGVRTAEFMGAMVLSGEQFDRQGIATRDVARATANLAMQQKQLAAFNGTTIEQEKEKQRMARQDAQLNMAMMGLSTQQQESIRQLSATFPMLGQFIKETVAFGGPMSKEALMQASIMGATTDAVGQTLAEIQSGADPKAAADALKKMSDNNAAMQEDLARARDIGILSIAGSQNSLVQMVTRDFQTQLELTQKLTAGVFDSIQEDAAKFTQGTDAATEAVLKVQRDFQATSIAVSGAMIRLLQFESIMEAITLPTSALRSFAEAVTPDANTADMGFMDYSGRAGVSTDTRNFGRGLTFDQAAEKYAALTQQDPATSGAGVDAGATGNIQVLGTKANPVFTQSDADAVFLEEAENTRAMLDALTSSLTDIKRFLSKLNNSTPQ